MCSEGVVMIPRRAVARSFLAKSIPAFILVLAVGCGSKSYTNATVTGVLKIDGRSAPAGITVLFQPDVENGSSSSGITDRDGRYELQYNAIRKGATAGMNTVSLLIEPNFTEEGKPSWPDGLEQVRKRLPAEVGQNPTLKKAVELGPNAIDIEVTLR